MVGARKIRFPPKAMEAFLQELGWGDPSQCLCSPLCWEGGAVPCYPWKSALLAWHPKDVPNLLSRGPPHPASQAVECKPSGDLKKKSGGAGRYLPSIRRIYETYSPAIVLVAYLLTQRPPCDAVVRNGWPLGMRSFSRQCDTTAGFTER